MFPVAVPSIFLGDVAPSSSAARLGCPISSLPSVRLRQLSTPAHACPLAVSATGSARVRGRSHSLSSLNPPQAAVASLPIPNTEVKLIYADDTWRATAWENK